MTHTNVLSIYTNDDTKIRNYYLKLRVKYEGNIFTHYAEHPFIVEIKAEQSLIVGLSCTLLTINRSIISSLNIAYNIGDEVWEEEFDERFVNKDLDCIDLHFSI